jgi:hypothetical protein
MLVSRSIYRSLGNTDGAAGTKSNRVSDSLVLALAMSSSVAWGAETSYQAGAGINYKYDDNINLAPINDISLEGWILDAFIRGQYSTGRFIANGDLKLDFERYTNSSIDTDDPRLTDPDPKDFNSDNQDLRGDIAYLWERSKLSLAARYDRDSTLNTQFLDTGLDNVLAIEGATRRTDITVTPGWLWQLTPRQTIDANVSWQQADFESERYSDYEYVSANVNWSYSLTERMFLQLQPYYSWYENDPSREREEQGATRVKSDTYGVQAGFRWAMTEKWQFDLLAGGAQVDTQYGDGGIIVLDPETGQPVLVEVEDQDSRSFVGDTTLAYTEEKYGFRGNLSSSFRPSGNGTLRQQVQGRLVFFWKPIERMRIDFDGIVGRDSTTDDRLEDINRDRDRDYRQVGVRLGYQFAQEWWISARYRYREQEIDSNPNGAGTGNSVFATLSYRLPNEIF